MAEGKIFRIALVADAFDARIKNPVQPPITFILLRCLTAHRRRANDVRVSNETRSRRFGAAALFDFLKSVKNTRCRISRSRPNKTETLRSQTRYHGKYVQTLDPAPLPETQTSNRRIA